MHAFVLLFDAPQPSKLDTVLITTQVQAYVDQVKRFSGAALGKLFMLDGLQASDSAAGAAGPASQ